jgi:hypothetical protein
MKADDIAHISNQVMARIQELERKQLIYLC